MKKLPAKFLVSILYLIRLSFPLKIKVNEAEQIINYSVRLIMNQRYKCCLLFLQLFWLTLLNAQDIPVPANLLNRKWSSNWISYPGTAQREYGVYHFRKSFTVTKITGSFIIHITADNRYRLFVNGEPVCSGPARGDLFNWYFETVDIARLLKPGSNTIAVLVWNMGVLAPVAQVSNQTGLVLQGNSAAEAVVNTDTAWKVYHNKAYTPTSLDNGDRLQAYMVVGPGDCLDGNSYPWGWEKPVYNDEQWSQAKIIASPYPSGYGTDNLWTLQPRNIPLFRETVSRFSSVRRSTGIEVAADFPQGNQKVYIPPHKTVKLLFDHAVNVVAYPELIVSGGKNSLIKLTYAESLFDKDRKKGNRNEIDGKEIMGNYDLFIADGGMKRNFRPLWLRAYRYAELEITTKEEGLTLESFYGMATGYPLEMKAGFSCNDSSLNDIWNTGWRTARLCAGDLYYDTPYYEQLQYTGDSRIQALISLYNSGDDRLMRKAITDFYHSRTPEGLTQGRYPSNRLQIIPTFSLFWVSMVYDYWMHKRDDAFIQQFLPAINEIMTWYESRIDKETGMLGPMKWWNFTDWDNFNGWGVAPGAENGHSSIISLQYASTLKQAAELFAAFGKKEQAKQYNTLSKEINKSVSALCFNEARGLYADTPDKNSYSQHAGIWAILSGAVEGKKAKKLMSFLLTDTSIGQVTFFYRFYLTQAMKKAELANLYYNQLKPWRDMLALGLTTFAEKPEPTRSDCHAWSASPNYDFLSTICGIMPAAPGFRKVKIAPALGELKWVAGSMPHPDGMISVNIKRNSSGKGIIAFVMLPEKLEGVFVWEGRTIQLHGGMQQIDFK